MADGKLIAGTAADGFPVAECELAPDETGLLPSLIQQAADSGAHRLWVHSAADLTPDGLTAVEGYRRLAIASCPAGTALPVLDAGTVAAVWPRAFAGQWGHKLVDAAAAQAATGSGLVFLGLPDGGQWAGICAVEPAGRRIDGPGFVGRPRTGDAVIRLVLGACAYLGPGAAEVETWGEPAAPYLALGFTVAEETPGWELILTE